MDLESVDILEKIVVFFNVKELFSLLLVSKQIRNIVAKSDIWKYALLASRHEIDIDSNELSKYVNVAEIFKLFTSIEFHKNPFKISSVALDQDWYYLYIMNIQLVRINTEYWNIHGLINNQNDMIKLCQISGFVSSPLEAKKYYDCRQLMLEVRKKLESSFVWNTEDKIPILRSIYVNISNYNITEKSNIIIISNRVMENIPEPQHFSYYFAFINADFCSCLFSLDGEEYRGLTALEFLEKISEMSEKLEVDVIVFSKIIRIILSRNSQCEQQINNFMKHGIVD